MRGRINSDLYSGIAINATTDQFEVSGGNIMAGDFVQYKYSEERKVFANNIIDYNTRYIHAKDNFYLSSAGISYKYENKDFVEVDSLPKACHGLVKLGNNSFAFLTKVTGELSFYIVSLNNNGEFVISAHFIDNSGSDNNYFNYIVKLNNNKIAVIGLHSNYDYINRYVVFDISDLSNISALNRGYISNTNMTGYILGVYNNALVFYGNSAVRQSDFDDLTNTFSQTDKLVANVSVSPNLKTSNITYNDRYYILLCLGQTLYVMNIYDAASGIVNVIQLTNSEFVCHSQASSSSGSINWDGTYISEIDENGYFYLTSSSIYITNNVPFLIGICKCHITSSGNVEVVGQIKTLQITTNQNLRHKSLPSVNMGNEAIWFECPVNTGTTEGNTTYYRNATVISGEIVLGERTDMVEPYDGTNPRMLMGVAATSGNVGSEIDVYVPLASA